MILISKKLKVCRDTLTDVTNTLKSTHLNTKQLRQDSESMWSVKQVS